MLQRGCHPLRLHPSTHMVAPGSPQIRPEVLVLTRKARDCPSPRPLQAASARVPWAQCRPASQMSPPSIPQARQDRCALPSPRPGPGEPAPCPWAPTLPGRWLLRPVASPAAASSRGPPAPSAHRAVAARYKPGRPPVLRLPDQATPAAASAPPAASEQPGVTSIRRRPGTQPPLDNLSAYQDEDPPRSLIG